MGWPELARLGFGAERTGRRDWPIGLEGDWLERFGALLGDEGRWAERKVGPGPPPRAERSRTLARPRARSAERGLAFPGRVRDLDALPDAGLPLHRRVGRKARGTGLARIQSRNRRGRQRHPGAAATTLAQMPIGKRPTRRPARRPARDGALRSTARVQAVDRHQRCETKWSRFCAPCAAGSSATEPGPSLSRRSAPRRSRACGARRRTGEKAENDRSARCFGSRRSSANTRPSSTICATTTPCASPSNGCRDLKLYVPVQRFEVLIKRRKGETAMRLDWHPLVRRARAAAVRRGPRYRALRLVCDDNCILPTLPDNRPACPAAEPWCRACYPTACPRCGHAIT